ncbi:MAG: prolipoprotein diacylglyceryl transferase, partial [Clostridia bacterium]|nr:prolipoprotein diacylglyceryl transferase [Clostridia bacterium]
FNQELYGVEVTNPALQHFPFAVYIDSHRAWHYASFFYEGVLNAIGLIIALLMFYLPKKPLKVGTFSLFYLMWYGLVRGTLEFLKGSDTQTIGNTGIKTVQLICYVMCAVTLVLQILFQFGKVRLETKWFENLCQQRRDALQEKAVAQAVAIARGEDVNADKNGEMQVIDEEIKDKDKGEG